MLIASLHKLFKTQTSHSSKSQVIFWLSLSFTFAVLYSILGLREAFSSQYVIQDDARQHVFWMQRFLDPDLFPNDWIANYYQAVSPLGYRTLYQLLATVGIEPILASKLLPMVLDLITTGYCFAACMQLLPVPLAGFLASLLLNQYLWLRDDLVSATAVAFVYPLFVAFLYYLLQRKLLEVCITITLLGLFYPQCVFICAGVLILQLISCKNWRFYPSKNSRDYRFCAIGLGVAVLVMSLYAVKSSGYNPVITASQARTLPEFAPNGISKFFIENFWHYWFTGQRSGMLPRLGTILPLIGALVLPLLCLFPAKFSLLKQVNQKIIVLINITLASLGMFFIAHALLFKLHLPSRYTEHSLRIVTAIAAGIAFTIILDAILQWVDYSSNHRSITQVTFQPRQLLALATASLLLTTLILNPSFLKRFPKTDYIVGTAPLLYEFFSRQPKDILIASVVPEVDNLPTFAKRSVLVGREYSVPYHMGYYNQIRQRTIDLVNAQYSPDLEQVQRFIQNYGIDFWLVDRGVFTPEYLMNNRWLWQYQPAANNAVIQLQQGITPVLSQMLNQCSVFETNNLIVLQTSCISSAASN